jgi:hypothetical protein
LYPQERRGHAIAKSFEKGLRADRTDSSVWEEGWLPVVGPRHLFVRLAFRANNAGIYVLKQGKGAKEEKVGSVGVKKMSKGEEQMDP